MTTKSSPLWLAVLLILIAACGEEEEELVATEQCADQDLAAFAVGSVTNDGETSTFELETDSGTPGRVEGAHEIWVQLGTAILPGDDPEEDDPHPLILRLYDAHHDRNESGEFFRYVENLTDEEPLVVDVFDATDIAAGSQDLTSLDDFDCTLEDTTLCVQVGFDTAGDGILFDDDEFVYNAVSGTVTIEGFKPSPGASFSAQWDVELGRNILVHQDESSGHFEGCFSAGYSPEGDYRQLH